MLVTDVAGVPASARTARCADGDPACDSDGKVDGTCTLQVRMCLDEHTDPAVGPGCGTDVVSTVALKPPVSALAPLASAVAALPMPAGSPTCTDLVAVTVAHGSRRSGRIVVRASAGMSSGHADRDRVALVCRRSTAATFATLVRKVFTPSCATFSCHGVNQAGGLQLLPESAYANLVGVLATNPAARGAGVLRVLPGDPDASFLVRKLMGTLGPLEGDSMPRVGTRLPAAQLELVRRWIAAGAPVDAAF
jgi:hypothetical protein